MSEPVDTSIRRPTVDVRRDRFPDRSRRDEGGFGLVELIVSLSVFSILIGGLTVTIGAGLGLARSNRERTVAANLAGQEVDAIRQASFSTLTEGLTTSTATVDGVPFTVARNLEWVNNNTTTGECDSTTTAPKVMRVTVVVSWTNMRAVQPYRTSTVLSPPVGSYDPLTGHIAVRVRSSDAVPLAGIPVRVQGTGVDQTINTTDQYAASAGCAIFAFLPAATYSVTLGTSGYVDRQGVASPSQSVGVQVGQVASVAFDYDRAATLDVTLAGVNGGTPADAVPVTLGNTGYLPAGLKVFTGTGATRSLTDLYPFTDGYDAFAGDCADADPEGEDSGGTPYWPAASRATPFPVDPAAATSGTITMATVQVDFSRSSSGTDTIQAVHAADSQCPAGSTLTIATFTTSTGSTLVALPYGTWTIQALGKTPVSSWPVVTLDPTSSATVIANVDI